MANNSAQLQLSIKNTDDDIIMIDIDSNSFVLELKRKFKNVEYIYLHLILVTENNRIILKDEKKLNFYGITNDSMLEMIVSIPSIIGGFGKTDGKFDYPQSICISPNNEFLFVSDMRNRIQVFDVKTHDHIKTFGAKDSLKTPKGMCVSHDNTMLFVADAGYNVIQVFDIASGNLLKSIGEPYLKYPTSVLCSNKGQIFVLSPDDELIKIFNVDDGKFTRGISLPLPVRLQVPIEGVLCTISFNRKIPADMCFLHNQTVLCVVDSSSISTYNVDDGSKLARITDMMSHNKPVQKIFTYAVNDKLYCLHGEENAYSINIYNADSHSEKYLTQINKKMVSSIGYICVSDSENIFIAASSDNFVAIF